MVLASLWRKLVLPNNLCFFTTEQLAGFEVFPYLVIKVYYFLLLLSILYTIFIIYKLHKFFRKNLCNFFDQKLLTKICQCVIIAKHALARWLARLANNIYSPPTINFIPRYISFCKGSLFARLRGVFRDFFRKNFAKGFRLATIPSKNLPKTKKR